MFLAISVVIFSPSLLKTQMQVGESVANTNKWVCADLLLELASNSYGFSDSHFSKVLIEASNSGR